MAVLLFCSFTPAKTVNHFRFPTSVDFIFYNNTDYEVDAATFSTNSQQLFYNTIKAGTSTPGTTIEIETTGDTFMYSISFSTPPKTASVVTVITQTRVTTEVIPAGIGAITIGMPLPLPTGGIVVKLDPQ
jgi:hypothetical protein